MTAPAWYSGDPSVNEAIAAKLDALTPADIAAAPLTKALDAKTAAYTLVAADAGVTVTVTDASASALTVPPNSAVAFPIGTVVEVIQLGAGAVTLTAGAGVTLSQPAADTLVLTQYATARLLKVATNTWIASGNLTAAA